MKTITLTDEAYKRLKDLKDRPGDSFSKVVLRVVPEKGTLGQMLDDVLRLPRLDERSAAIMEEASRFGSETDIQKDKWTI